MPSGGRDHHDAYCKISAHIAAASTVICLCREQIWFDSSIQGRCGGWKVGCAKLPCCCRQTTSTTAPPSLASLLVYFLKVSWLASRERRPSGLELPVPSSPSGPSTSFLWIISNSMVISTRPESSSPPPPTLSVFLTTVCCCCVGRAFATTWRTGWSSRPASPPQPLPVSYFLSLRDSCFFFSDAAAFTLEGSAGGTGPCGGGGRGGRVKNRGGESLQEERSVGETETERGMVGQWGRGEEGQMGELEVRPWEMRLGGWSCVKRREEDI